MNVKCKCGCDLFEQIIPCVFDDSDFRAWHSGSELAAEIRTIPALRCIQCGKLSVPPTSLVGRTMLDPAVQAYGRLLEYVENWNKGIENSEKNLDVMQKNINRIHELQAEFRELKEPPEPPPTRIIKEGVDPTKTNPRKKKDVKAS